ncbi:putative peptide transport fused subunits of ABC superfamily: ATP-binding components [Sterolibacterium denitrificans]|uniref:ABC transporter ATP-binding protein n=2 Tax=Sterolibacterium denitrificans TaxID=157592 RepID=A0A656Z9W2_9PROT|nr:ABC transporter ATP-binding protein [Sterolibacterium denitrificans]KYC29186.1 ABC transporter ATP-binding protein [Sterolibacterium denitrificans]SMB29497.1 putative peptide transport fused subunits of ABC superfamily: ATP-binding components [Sterolibacterium denitrificans]
MNGTPPETAPSAAPLLRVRNLAIGFRSGRRQPPVAAVKGIDFEIPENATVALVGESGSGKSVTALSILGLLPRENAVVEAGSQIIYGARNLLELAPGELRALRGRDISMIFQEPMSSLNPVFTVGSQIGEVLRLHLGMTPRQAMRRTVELLDEVGIPDPQAKSAAYPFQLSGGQQQRVMIAMAIACQPRLLIADEPTTALDVTIQKQILELLNELQQRHRMAMLFITHDLAVVGDIAERVIVMRHGEIREQGSTRSVFEAPQDAYTRALLACRPSLARRPRRLPVIEDFLRETAQPPQPTQPPQAADQERPRGIAPGDSVILDVRHLSKNFYSRSGLFGRREFKAMDEVSFRLRRGKTLGIVGESGSGKTTLGLTLMRLHRASGGAALFEGRDILAMSPAEFQSYKRRIQIIFQNPYASLNPRFTVGQILDEPMLIHGIGGSAAERHRLARELLDRVGLPATAAERYPHEFSGGQRQRIAIARCLTLKPDILICDESVSALDVSVQAQVLNLLQDLQDEAGLSYIFISHDLAVVHYMSDEVLVMHQGRAVECADADEIYARPQQEYTRRLLQAMPGKKCA